MIGHVLGLNLQPERLHVGQRRQMPGGVLAAEILRDLALGGTQPGETVSDATPSRPNSRARPVVSPRMPALVAA